MIFLRHNMMIIGRPPSLHPHPAKITKCGCRTGLPPLLGWVGMLPCLAGLLAVILLWRKQPQKANA
jgi:hypothetical protein